MASAGNFSSCARSINLSRRHAPSSSEYSVCKCKWTKSACDMADNLPFATASAQEADVHNDARLFFKAAKTCSGWMAAMQDRASWQVAECGNRALQKHSVPLTLCFSS